MELERLRLQKMEKALKMRHNSDACGDSDTSLWRKARFEEECFLKIRNTDKFYREVRSNYNLFSLGEVRLAFK